MNGVCPDCGLLYCPEGSIWKKGVHCARAWLFGGEIKLGNGNSHLDCATAAIARLRTELAATELRLQTRIDQGNADYNERSAQLQAASACVESADAMRSWYRKQMDPDGPEVDYDTKRAAFERIKAGGEP